MNRQYTLYNNTSEIRNLRELLLEQKIKRNDNPVFCIFENTVPKYIGYDHFHDHVIYLCNWIHNNYMHGKHIGILGENSYEWLVVFMAIVSSGNVAVALDKDMPEDELCETVKLTKTTVLFSSAKCMKKVQSVFGDNGTNIKSYSFNVIEGMDSYSENDSGMARVSITSDTPCCIFLTSGTTGGRKAVTLTHGNIAADINGSCKLFCLDGDTYAILPFHHAFGLIVGVLMVFHYGHTVYIGSGLRRIKTEMQNAHPQTMMLVPLFVESFYKQIFDVARKQGREYELRFLMWLADFLLCIGVDVRKKLFRKIRDEFGGNLEYIICGGASLDERYIRAFRSFGIEILNGYGTSECSPVVAVNRNNYHRDGSVGLAIPGSKVCSSEDGEIIICGEHVMAGYYGDDHSTNEVLKDGWYHTGDLGYIDRDGFIFLTGRKKNLIVLANGENVSPEELEQKLLRIDGITECVVAERNNSIVAEIYTEDEKLEEIIQGKVDKLNKSLPSYKQIADIVFRDKPFEKTTSQKIIR